MTPAEEARYLRLRSRRMTPADRRAIAADTRLDWLARLVTSAVLIGRATRIERGEDT